MISFLAIVHTTGATTVPKNDTITCGGIDWNIKYGGQLGHGANYWSSSGDNVWVDNQNRLHLTIKKSDSKWYCTEIQSQKLYKYVD